MDKRQKRKVARTAQILSGRETKSRIGYVVDRLLTAVTGVQVENVETCQVSEDMELSVHITWIGGPGCLG